ncbi:hypothetical protein GH808_07455 [Acetobacterium fimetarium]|uniref:Uncharacterized protein n=1 Tax=Acetobacterium fimetarium TaxID=52691 RepID=A0ABR6WV16_9FIRM|nr:hypothetical protein [Acetobacterium fimetarium]MBC3804268.1 hypothetical protein [Acetobacterium fimetarium]
MGLKPPLTYDDQIERLKKNGVEISDHDTALSVLSEANKFKPVSGARTHQFVFLFKRVIINRA